MKWLSGKNKILSKNKTADRKWRFVYDGEQTHSSTIDPLSKEKVIFLAPIRTLSVHPFEYPFTSTTRVRDALRLKFRPLIGDHARDLYFVPVVTQRKPKSISGAVFLVSKSEVEEIERKMRIRPDTALWVAPLAYAEEVAGNGLVQWRDEAQICSMLFENWQPRLYRWTSLAGKGADAADEALDADRDWFEGYARQQGGGIERICLVDPRMPNAPQPRMFSDYVYFDLSPSGANVAERVETFFQNASTIARRLVLLGGFFVLVSLALWLGRMSEKDLFTVAPGEVYGASFGERASNPTRAARAKVGEVRSTPGQFSFTSVIAAMLPAWQGGTSGDLKLEAVRYSAEKMEIQGTAKNMETIQKLQNAIQRAEFTARAGDIQQIPGGDFRFNLSVQGGKR